MRRKCILLLLVSTLLLFGCAQDSAAPPPNATAPSPVTDAAPSPMADAAPSPVADAAPSPMADAPPSPEATAPPAPEATAAPSPVVSAEPSPYVEVDPNRHLPQKLKDAIAVNGDVVGWIEIPNTSIDAPILHDRQWFYAEHNIHREPDSEGCVISHYKVLTRNTTIQGKNMRKSGGGLHELHKLQDNAALLAERENRLCRIDFQWISEWEIFALYETTSSEPAETLRYNIQPLGEYNDGGATDAWIAYQKERSELKDIIDVPVKGDDLLMTIMTGGDYYEPNDTQSRLYVFLKAVV